MSDRSIGGRGVLGATTRGVCIGTFVAVAALLGFGVAPVLVPASAPVAQAQQAAIRKTDFQIDGRDAGVKLGIREKIAEGAPASNDANVVLFLHGATSPGTCDFDLSYKDYSWADRLVRQGFAVYMGDYRNYGASSRQAAMDEPAAKSEPLTRSYLALRDIESMVDAIKRRRGVKKIAIIGWSWGAMMAGYYASLHSDDISKLVLYAPLYDYNDHTNLGPGSGLQNKRKPREFNFALGGYRIVPEAANTGRWNGEIPLDNKDDYRDPAVPAAFWADCLATDPTSASRTTPSLRAPNGVLEDSFYQATGRPLWSATSIYAPTLVIAGAFDTWSFPEDREGLMRDLVHAKSKRSVLIPDATHFVIFEKNRNVLFDTVSSFLKE